jgi:hypothetical protein
MKARASEGADDEVRPSPHPAAIEAAVRTNAGLSESVARDVAFHMTDWLDDLAAYQHFCAHPEKSSPSEITNLLMAFLLHVPNHVAAASKLFTGIPLIDIFDVGSTTDTD